MPDRPNILVLMTDQQRADAMGCAGNTTIRTPNLDALASSGIRFAQAVTPHPRLRCRAHEFYHRSQNVPTPLDRQQRATWALTRTPHHHDASSARRVLDAGHWENALSRSALRLPKSPHNGRRHRSPGR